MRVPPTDRLMFDTLLLLSTRLPLGRPVKFRMVDRKSTHGTTTLDRDGFTIQISRGCRHCMLDALLHEWGHARKWRSNHRDRWGIEYARAYRLIMEESR